MNLSANISSEGDYYAAELQDLELSTKTREILGSLDRSAQEQHYPAVIGSRIILRVGFLYPPETIKDKNV